MARLPRYFVKGQAQHIIQRGNNRELVFVGDEDHPFYLECLQDAAKRHELLVHAYVHPQTPLRQVSTAQHCRQR